MFSPLVSIASFRRASFFNISRTLRPRSRAASAATLTLCALTASLPLIAAPAAHAQAKKTTPTGKKGLNFAATVPTISSLGAQDTQHLYTNSYAIIIGISHYKVSSHDLVYADKDATDLRDILVKSYDFPRSHITLLTNGDATKDKIEEALSDLADGTKYTEGTRVLVYFSGHGATVKNPAGGDTGFLIPYDAEVNLQHPENRSGFQKTCLPMSTVWDYFAACSARHMFLIADACYGGLLAHSKAFAYEKTSAKVLKEILARPARQVLTAGGAGETVEENPEWGHGALTYKLLEELKVQAATPNNVFLASELGNYLTKSVSNLTDGQQRPVSLNRDTEGDFVFYTTTASAASTTPVSVSGPAHSALIAPEESTNVVTVPATAPAINESAISLNASEFAKFYGQPVKVSLIKELKSGDGNVGDKIDFVVSEDVVPIGQSAPIILKGTPAVGHLLESKKGGFMGKAGKLKFACDYIVMKDGTRIPLRSDQDNGKSGNKNTGTMAAAIVFSGGFGLLVKGGNTTIHPEDKFTVYIGPANPVTSGK